MKRKVIQIANSTFLVSLPRTWTGRFNIVKGEELDVLDNGTRVIISTERSKDVKTKELSFKDMNATTIKKLLYGLYNVGYEEVRINFDAIESLDIVHNVLRDEMIGYEIIEQKEDYIIIKSIAGVFETEFDNMLRRAFILFKTMSQGILEAMKKSDTKTLKSLASLEVNNNKYIAFCIRILAKRGYIVYEKTNLMYGVLRKLEEAADELKYLCSFFEEDKNNIKKIDKNIIEFYGELIVYIEECYNLFYNFSFQKADLFLIKRKDLIEKGFSITRLSDARHMRIAYYSINIIQFLADLMAEKMDLEL